MLFNGHKINEVIIDQHYKLKHPEMSDDLILKLVNELNRESRLHTHANGNFLYYVEDPIFYNGKPYRLIFLMESGYNYIGVVNAFRVKEKKNGISL
jgi:hypothetical protein